VPTRHAAAVFVALALLAAACGDDAPIGTTTAATTTTAAATTEAPTTTAAPSTTLAPSTTTTAAAPTTAATTTTTAPAFDGTTDPKHGITTGDPAAPLVDVRVGSHPGFTRVVWEMQSATGTPLYTVGYDDPPFANTGEQVIPVDGTAFLRVSFFPGMRFDISGPEAVQTYFGPEAIPVGSGSVVEVVFLDDFEAQMEWVIGLTGEQPFNVFTLENPTRLVVDIGD
jgi:hypothetical protein